MDPIRYNDTPDYQYASVFETKGVFTSSYIQEESLPDGFYKYSLRTDPFGVLDALCKDADQNHAGDFITKEPVDLGPTSVRLIRDGDWKLEDKEFQFEEYFGTKLSIDTQISLAAEKREQLVIGKGHEKQTDLKNDSHGFSREDTFEPVF